MKAGIRRYQSEDREALRQIAFDTAFMGRSAEIFFDGAEFIKDVLTLYFTDHASHNIWIAEIDGSVVGYIMGSQDEHEMQIVLIFIRSTLLSCILI